MTANSKNSGWDGEERRKLTGGRREFDQCLEHCVFVKQWEDLRAMVKENTDKSERKLASAAPLWSVLVLIGLIVGSVAYTFRESAAVRADFADKIVIANTEIRASLQQIQIDLAVFQNNQSQILKKIEGHFTHERKEQ